METKGDNMREETITRDQLRDWINAGIKQGQKLLLSDENANKLRDVAETLPHVAFGAWHASNNVSCGCPAVEAGIIDLGDLDEYEVKIIKAANNYINVPGIRGFTFGFDSAVSNYLGYGSFCLGYDSFELNEEDPPEGILFVQD